jgi:hypothetical protein
MSLFRRDVFRSDVTGYEGQEKSSKKCDGSSQLVMSTSTVTASAAPLSASSASSASAPLDIATAPPDIELTVSPTEHVGCFDAFLFRIGARSRRQAIGAGLDALEMAARTAPLIDRVQGGIVRFQKIYGGAALQNCMLMLLTSINGGIRQRRIRLSTQGASPLRKDLYALLHQTTASGKIDTKLAARVLLSTLGEEPLSCDMWVRQVCTFEENRGDASMDIPMEVRELFSFIEESVTDTTRDDETRLRTLWTFLARGPLGVTAFTLSLPKLRDTMAAAGRARASEVVQRVYRALYDGGVRAGTIASLDAHPEAVRSVVDAYVWTFGGDTRLWSLSCKEAATTLVPKNVSTHLKMVSNMLKAFEDDRIASDWSD